MEFNRFQEFCKEKVVEYFNERVEKTDNTKITKDDVFVVWYCKTLQNAKALLSTNVSDGMYYELTYNGDKNELEGSILNHKLGKLRKSTTLQRQKRKTVQVYVLLGKGILMSFFQNIYLQKVEIL